MKTNCGLCCVHHRQVQWVRPQIALVEHERNQLLILPNSTFHIQGDGRWSYGEPKTLERKRHSPVFRCVWIPRPPVPCLHRNLKLQSPLQIDAWLAIPKPMSMHFQQLPCKKISLASSDINIAAAPPSETWEQWVCWTKGLGQQNSSHIGHQLEKIEKTSVYIPSRCGKQNYWYAVYDVCSTFGRPCL